jgi:hypothetical protein
VAELTASADIRGQRIDLSISLTGALAGPRVRVVRRRDAYSESPDDGLIVFDSADLFRDGASSPWSIPFTPSGLSWDLVRPWGRIERERYLLLNAPTDGGLRQAEITSFFTGPLDAQPARAMVAIHDDAGDTTVLDAFLSVGQRITAGGASPSVELFDSAATSLGKMVIPASPGSLTWTRTGAAPVNAAYGVVKSWITTGTLEIGVKAQLRASFITMEGAAQRLASSYEQTLSPDTGDVLRTITIEDTAGVDPQTVYYYSVYLLDPGGTAWKTPREELRASVMSTGTFGMQDRLYALLPSIHRYNDEPTPALAGTGQLRRFLQVFGAGLDQARGFAEGLRDRQAIERVRVEQVPELASWIAWQSDQTLPSYRQRMDVVFAPELYSTVGTLPNIKRMVERETGWLCEIKELVHNVFMTNAAEPLHIWELWSLSGQIDSDEPITTKLTEAPAGSRSWFDGRPAVAADPMGVLWLFWHSTRSGRRELWCQKIGDTEPARPVFAHLPIDSPNDTWSDSAPAVVLWNGQLWLFWDSDRAGTRDIWAWPFTDKGTGPAPQRVTSHPAEDRSPAVMVDGGNQLWLFWQSNRRGPIDIWAETCNIVAGEPSWSAPVRVTGTDSQDLTPAAVLDPDGHVRLLWSRARGNNAAIYEAVFSAGAWSEPEQLPEVDKSGDPVPAGYDESPAIVVFTIGAITAMFLYFASNRDGRKKLWLRAWIGGDWTGMDTTSGILTSSSLEPAFHFDNATGSFSLFFRSTESESAFQSRTYTNDPEAKKRSRPDDRWHYLHDSARTKEDWYARDTVGLYLTPPLGSSPTPAEVLDKQAEINARVKQLIEPYRPLQVRFLWFFANSSETGLPWITV